MPFNPTYTSSSGSTPVSTNPVPITIDGKVIPGYLTTFNDGTSKWTSVENSKLNSGFDYSTFTSEKNSSTGQYEWKATTPNSIPNLSTATGLTQTQILAALQTPQFQTPLNGIRIQQLGGTASANQIDANLPLSTGTTSDLSSTNIPTLGTPTDVKNLGITQSKFLTEFTSETYPEKMNVRTQDHLKFELIEYGVRRFRSGSIGFLDSPLTPRENSTTSLGIVYLPIQPQISDQNGVNWGEEQMNAFQLLGAAAAKNPETIPDLITSGINQITSNETYKELLLKQIAGMAVGINPLARTDGLVVNPNLELLFNGPTLRPFTFVFRLSPRKNSEAKKVKKIIRFFKEGSAVKTTNTGLFLKAPNVFKITYQFSNGKGTSIHPGIGQIKTCALRSVSVNYTPDGSYATFWDGTMTSYELTLQFTELEPIYDKTYQEEGDLEKNLGGIISY